MRPLRGFRERRGALKVGAFRLPQVGSALAAVDEARKSGRGHLSLRWLWGLKVDLAGSLRRFGREGE